MYRYKYIMSSLNPLDFNHQLFIDKVTVLYGETKTGKSTIIVDILHEIKPFADQIIVFSPTDRNNHTYSGTGPDDRIVPLPCIHYTISPTILKDIWERQEALVAVYRRASASVSRLFERVASADEVKVLQFIRTKRDERRAEVDASIIDPVISRRKKEEITADCDRFIDVVQRNCINNNRGRLERMGLTAEERYALNYVNLNPRLVLIFDDCTEEMNRLKNNKVIADIAYQGRHVMITTIIAAHTDKSLDSAFRKNAFNNFFTETSCARAYFNRATNDFDRESKNAATTALAAAFTPSEPFQKLVWVREDKKYYRYTARRHDNFVFGCPEVWSYCDKVASDGAATPRNNRFMAGFM